MLQYERKIKNREETNLIVADWKKQGLKIGFTSGSFDLIHPGHVEYLALARSKCDRLVVGLNSDSSVSSYKSKDRPINTEHSRALVLAAIESVDLVFIFSELNNNENIKLIEPNFYIKAGDYNEDKLSSAPLVKAYGGEIIIIPFKSGFSTSSIIDNILMKNCATNMIAPTQLQYEKRPAIFLDRDGTLIEFVDYLHEPEKVRSYMEGFKVLKQAKDLGFRLIIVTNQPGIGLGLFTKEDFFKVNLEMFKQASQVGLTFDKVYYSPYGKADNTNCRKPNNGMIDRAVKELNIDLDNSYVVGDSTVDVKLANNAGIKGVLVETGNAGKDGLTEAKSDFIAKDLADAINFIISDYNK
jgi:rfaE bifunctional protein nucleotidyltransferase chain/domain